MSSRTLPSASAGERSEFPEYPRDRGGVCWIEFGVPDASGLAPLAALAVCCRSGDEIECPCWKGDGVQELFTSESGVDVLPRDCFTWDLILYCFKHGAQMRCFLPLLSMYCCEGMRTGSVGDKMLQLGI